MSVVYKPLRLWSPVITPCRGFAAKFSGHLCFPLFSTMSFFANGHFFQSGGIICQALFFLRQNLITQSNDKSLVNFSLARLWHTKKAYVNIVAYLLSGMNFLLNFPLCQLTIFPEIIPILYLMMMFPYFEKYSLFIIFHVICSQIHIWAHETDWI